MNKPSLIQISNEIENLGKQIIEQGGEIAENQEKVLSELLVQEANKVDAYVNFLEQLEHEIMFVKMKIKEAELYVTRLAKTQNSLEIAALKAIEIRGSKLKGNFGKWISTRKTVAVKIQEVSLLTQEYLRIKTVYEPDKNKIKEDLEKGKDVPGCELIENQHVTWR
jgi:hypothetical protein